MVEGESGSQATDVVGVLADVDIIAEAKNGRLIATNFSTKNVHQACYEVRAGKIYYDLSNNAQRIVLDARRPFILLKPHQLVVVITLEALSLPANIVGRIMMKGRLFSLGLQPISTNADPGFTGHLGIVIYNSSPNFIRIDKGTPIAKIEFERLPSSVANPYSGQHGYQSEIWPIPTHMIIDPRELRSDPRIVSLGEELERAYGKNFASVIDRVFRFERVLLLSAFSYILLAMTIVIVSGASRLSTTAAVGLGLITNIVSSVLIFVATSLKKK